MARARAPLCRARGRGARAPILLALLVPSLVAWWGCASLVPGPAAARPVLETGPPMPVPRAAHAAALLDGQIFVVGGGRRGDVRAWRLELSTDEWFSIADAPRHRAFPAAAAHDGRLYVVGGLDSPAPGVETYPSEIDVFDPSTDTWSSAGAMPRPRGRFGSVQFGAELWIVGGYVQGVGNVPYVDVFALDTQTWREEQDLPLAVHGCAVAVSRGDVLVVGDQTHGERAWRMTAAQPASERVWNRLPDAPVSRLFAAGVASTDSLNGRETGDAFIIVGDRARGVVEVLGFVRTQSGWQWSTAENAAISTHRGPVVNVDGLIYSLGGEDVDGETADVQKLRPDSILWNTIRD